jgi:hypothetical protein
MPGVVVENYLPPLCKQPARRGVTLSSIIEFAVVCHVRLSVSSSEVS